MKAFKGFDKNLQCCGFQYEVGKTYEHDGIVKLCQSGFHACENPLDVWRYYDPTESRFAVVTCSDVIKKNDDSDSKLVSAKITIDAEISFGKYVTDAVDWMVKHCTKHSKGTAASSGNFSTAASSGDGSKAASSGNFSKAASSGNFSTAAASGDGSTAASSGDDSKAASSGDYSTAASSGYRSTAAVDGENCAAAAVGRNAKAKGSDGSWLAVSEYDNSSKCIGFAVGCVGKDGIAADTYYVARGGKLVRA